MDSKVIALWSNAKYHFNALILTVVMLFRTTGLIEDSSHRAFARDAAICVKGKSAMQGKYLSFEKEKQFTLFHKTFWNSLVFSNQTKGEKRYQRNYCVQFQ